MNSQPVTPASSLDDRWTPSRPPSVVADVGVPLLSSVITASLISLLAASIIILWPFAERWQLAIPGGLSVMLIAWFSERNLLRRTLWQVERHTGLDLDRDQHAGPPPHPLEINPAQQRKSEIAREQQRLRQFVSIAHRTGTAERGLRAHMRDLKTEEYTRWRDILIQMGLARWKGSNRMNGWYMIETIPARTLKRLEEAEWL